MPGNFKKPGKSKAFFSWQIVFYPLEPQVVFIQPPMWKPEMKTEIWGLVALFFYKKGLSDFWNEFFDVFLYFTFMSSGRSLWELFPTAPSLKVWWMTPRRDIYSNCSDFNRLETNFLEMMSPEITMKHWELWCHDLSSNKCHGNCVQNPTDLCESVPANWVSSSPKTVAPDSTAGRGVPSRSLRIFKGWSMMSHSCIRDMLNLHGYSCERCPVLYLRSRCNSYELLWSVTRCMI